MNSLLIGQRYIIRRIHNGNTKPPMDIESLVEILKINNGTSNIVTVKYLSGLSSKINTIQKIYYDNYTFEFVGDKYKELEEEFMRFTLIEAEVRTNLDKYLEIKDVIHKNIKRYKEMEWEVMILRFAFIIIIWMYIKGVIKIA
jgi:hypothetical protein